MDFPIKTDHCITGTLYGDVLMMPAIFIDDTYANLKRVTWVSCSNDIGGF